jgi:hypothetical protein
MRSATTQTNIAQLSDSKHLDGTFWKQLAKDYLPHVGLMALSLIFGNTIGVVTTTGQLSSMEENQGVGEAIVAANSMIQNPNYGNIFLGFGDRYAARVYIQEHNNSLE